MLRSRNRPFLAKAKAGAALALKLQLRLQEVKVGAIKAGRLHNTDIIMLIWADSFLDTDTGVGQDSGNYPWAEPIFLFNFNTVPVLWQFDYLSYRFHSSQKSEMVTSPW